MLKRLGSLNRAEKRHDYTQICVIIAVDAEEMNVACLLNAWNHVRDDDIHMIREQLNDFLND